MVAFVTVLVILGVCGAAYYSYVSSREAYLTERNFRFLGNQSRALIEVMANYEKVFQSILQGTPAKVKEQRARVTDEELLCLGDNLSPADLKKRTLGAALCALPSLRRVTLDDEPDMLNPAFDVGLRRETKEPVFVLNYTAKDRASTVWHIRAEIDAAKVMDQLMSEDIFADILLANKDGTVIYQKKSRQDASDFQFSSLSVLFQNPGQADAKKDGGEKKQKEPDKALGIAEKLPALHEVTLGETRYQVFAQGGVLPSHRMGGAKNSSEFILTGIVPSRKFSADARAISGNMLLLLICILLFAFFGLPYLKLKSMGPKDRLSLTDVLVLLFVSLMGAALMTFVILDFLTYQATEQLFDEKLRQSAEDIQKHFHDDLLAARRQLNDFDTFLAACETAQFNKTSPWQTGFLIAPNGTAKLVFGNPSPACRKSEGPALSYYDVNDMLWVWPDGFNNVDWSRGQEEWAQLQLRDREYVKRIWTGSALESPDDRFWLQPIYSWTTGQNYAIVSQQSRVKPADAKDGQRSVVAALEMKMPSVMDPVVLPGFGFAVIEQSGKVLFHSDSRRNLRENFFEETDQNGRLRSLVFARTKGHFDGRYWGIDRRFYAAPLPDMNRYDTAWSVVAYRDNDLLQTANLQALTVGASLFLLYAALILGVGLFGLLIYPSFKRGRTGWLWPHPPRTRDYQLIVLWNIILLCLFGVLILQPLLPAMNKLLFAFILPLLGMWIMIPTLRRSRARESETAAGLIPLSYRWSYTLMIMTLLLVYSLLPAFGFFKLAFDAEMQLLLKHAQFDLLQDLDGRAQRVKAYYHHVKGGDDPQDQTATDQFFNDWLRLDKTRDIYGNFYGSAVFNFNSFLLNAKGTEQATGFGFDEVHAFLRAPLDHSISIETGGFLGRGTDQSWRREGPTYRSLALDSHSASRTGTDLAGASPVPTVPGWLYWILAFGGLLAALGGTVVTKLMASLKTRYRSAKSMIALLSLLFFAWSVEIWTKITLEVLLFGVGIGIFAWLLYAIPRLIARRVFLLDLPEPPVEHQGADQSKRDYARRVQIELKTVSPDLRDAFIEETNITLELQTIGERFMTNAAKINALKKIEDVHDVRVGAEEIILEVLNAAEKYYEGFWESYSSAEKLALFHLAKYRFLNSGNTELRRLLHKGIIVRDPDLRLMNESFRRFILSMAEKEHLTAWEYQGARSAWSQVWRPVGIGLVVIAMFLISTQEEYKAIMLAFFTVLPAALAALPQLFSGLRREKNGIPSAT